VAYYHTTYESSTGQRISVETAIGWLKDRIVADWVSDPDFKERAEKRAGRLAFMS